MKKIFKSLFFIISMAITGCNINTNPGGKRITGEIKIEQTVETLFNHQPYYSCCPSTGNIDILVIPVWFSNSDKFIEKNKKENVLKDIDTVFNGSNKETGWRSVSEYYKELSFDFVNKTSKLNLNFIISDWYEANKHYNNYATSSKGFDNTLNLLDEATDSYFNSTKQKRSSFDKNADGYIDGVIMIYGCPDYVSIRNSNYDNLWAYTTLVGTNPSTAVPSVNHFIWASYDFMYSHGDKAQRATGFRFGNGDNSNCAIDSHTYIHEFGHMLGLQDYYDYAESYEEGGVSYGYTPAGCFSMQDYNVGSHDPFSVMSLGWADPLVIGKEDLGKEIIIGDFQNGHDLILLSPEFNDKKSAFDEYILIELYSPTGLNEFDVKHSYHGQYPQGPNTLGIRVWHVDARVYSANSKNKTIYNHLPNSGAYYLAMSNTYANDELYRSQIGDVYGDYVYDCNILQLIRNNVEETYRPKESINSYDLFRQGDTFTMKEFSSQFVNGSLLNNKQKLGYGFTVKNISSNSFDATLIFFED